MTSFVHVDYPQQHPGVARVEAAIQAAGSLRQGFDGTRGIAALLLAAVVSALLVLADRMVDGWADGRLMAAWVVLWLVAFAALALFATPARRLATALVQRLDGWSQRVARDRADERLWATAQTDARVMADLKAAVSRSELAARGLRRPCMPLKRRSASACVKWCKAGTAMCKRPAPTWPSWPQPTKTRACWPTCAPLPPAPSPCRPRRRRCCAATTPAMHCAMLPTPWVLAAAITSEPSAPLWPRQEPFQSHPSRWLFSYLGEAALLFKMKPSSQI